jgi:protein-S-isoprenylcysteine O-methyltransferase Ste14
MSAQKKFIERIRTKLSRVAGLCVFVFFACCGSKWDLKNPLFEEIFAICGLLLVSMAACGRLWCMLYIAGHKTKELIVAGPYSLCRNPLYLFSFLGTIGMGLGSGTFTVPIVFVLAFSLFYPFTVKKEEDRLLFIHGDEFKRYCEKTPRYFPSFKNYTEPEQCIVSPRIFRKHVGNAMLWIWIFGAWEIFEYLRIMKWLPTFVTIW